MEDDDLDNIGPGEHKHQQDEQDPGLPDLGAEAERDPDLADDIKRLRPRTDLTDDVIDWDAVNREDDDAARRFAMRKQWDEDRFADLGFCAVCSLTVKPTFDTDAWKQQQQSKKLNCLAACNAAVFERYEKTNMLELLTDIQQIYVERQLQRMPAGEVNLGEMKQVKFWSRRAIYEHLHKHHYTDYIRLVQDVRRNDRIQNEAYRSVVALNPLTGVRAVDIKMVNCYTKMMSVGNCLRRDLDKMRRAGGSEFF